MIEVIDKHVFRQAPFSQIIKLEARMNRMSLIFTA